MPAELLVERFEYVADLEILGAVDRIREVAPEIAQYLLPVDPPARDVVELVFQIGGEIVFDIALEKAGEESGHQPATVLRYEAALVEPHVIAILQNLNDRGIGRGPADAEFLELLDQACFAVARRRLGEMLTRGYHTTAEPLFFLHRRQTPVFLIFRRVVLVFLVELQEAVEHDRRAGRVQTKLAAWVGDVDADLVQHRRFHLAGEGTLPD